MATSQATIDDLLPRLASAGRVTARKMFGEYCLYLQDRPVALVCDDELFVKITDAGQEVVPNAGQGHPYPGAKAHFHFPADEWSDAEKLCELLRVTFREVPPPKPQKRGKRS